MRVLMPMLVLHTPAPTTSLTQHSLMLITMAVLRLGSSCQTHFGMALQVGKRFAHPDVLHIGQSRCTPAVAPDDSCVAVGASSGLLVLLKMDSGALERKLSCHNAAITAVAWNAQDVETPVVAASCDRAGALVFWRGASDVAQH